MILPTSHILRVKCGSTQVAPGFPGGSDGKESACHVGDLGSIPGLGRSPGGGHGNSLQYTCLENPHGQRSPAGYSPWGHKESDAQSSCFRSCQPETMNLILGIVYVSARAAITKSHHRLGSLNNTVSLLRTDFQVANFQRWECVFHQVRRE